jgi:hypothetical protein
MGVSNATICVHGVSLDEPCGECAKHRERIPESVLSAGFGSHPHWRSLVGTTVQRRVDLFYALHSNPMIRGEVEADPEDMLMCLGAISLLATSGRARMPEHLGELLTWMAMDQSARDEQGERQDPGESAT